MKVVTAEEMQRIDRVTIDEIGIPGEVLMGYAGKSAADYIFTNFPQLKKAAVFSGVGNNGGDGFVIAYLLSNKGIPVDIYIAGNISKVTDTSNIYLSICKKNKINITILDDNSLNKINLNNYELIIDALLGTGFKGSPRSIVKEAITAINSSSAKVLSVDLPSGLPSDGEAPEGEVVDADHTVTIGLPKISLVIYPGKRYTGILHVSDIGFPMHLTDSMDLSVELLKSSYVKSILNLNKDAESYKNIVGHLLLVGGFDGMEGAIFMSAMAAFETGVGLATLLTTHGARNIIAGKIPELITRSLNSFNSEAENEEIGEDILSFFREDRLYDAMIIGPGMGRSELSAQIFNVILNNINRSGINKVLIDGDGLFHLSEYLKINKLPDNVSFVITPHFGEASMLLNTPVQNIKNNRLQSAKDLSIKTGSVVVLKGPATIITDSSNSFINTTGNPALGTAGSGDVLSGIIGALLLGDLLPLQTAAIGAYIHGLTADILVKEYDMPVLKATDLIDYIRIAVAETSNS
jgi:ADP-dependent NAD(P)H-hydrate dehydratase / NAD(P)H-hydrate epimerase